jgi:hypothetical protein
MKRLLKISPTTVALLIIGTLSAQEVAPETFKVLRVGPDTYTNVVITGKTQTDVYLKHDGGIINIRRENLDLDIQEQLGYEVKRKPTVEAKKSVATLSATLTKDPRVQEVTHRVTTEMESRIGKIGPQILVAFAIGMVAAYFFISFCFYLIVKRTGNQPGIMVWLPVLQMFPLLKAAGMPAWWFLMLFLPVLNLVACVMWSFKIAQACGKSAWVGLMLLLPFTNFIALLYLAFSGSGQSPVEVEPEKTVIKLA